MPFPLGQESEYFYWAYIFSKWKYILLIFGIIVSVFPFIKIWQNGKWLKKTMLVFLFIVCTLVLIASNIFMNPNRMFREPVSLIFKNGSSNNVPMKSVVIGVTYGGVSKAYPLPFIIYHHKIQDTIGGKPILVTYCGLCRSGRIFSPIIDGKHFRFGIVGVHHNNAIFVDDQTNSWWYQETGEALFGPMKGEKMEEVFCEQSSLESWLERHPESLIMQTDPKSEKMYKSMSNDFSFSPTALLDNVSGELNPYALIAGVKIGASSKAYNWSDLLTKRVVNDKVGETPVLVFLENDSLSFHAWKRVVNGETLDFVKDSTANFLIDKQTNSNWNSDGKAVRGKLKGIVLEPVSVYQEYWRSWETFNPTTEVYSPK